MPVKKFLLWGTSHNETMRGSDLCKKNEKKRIWKNRDGWGTTNSRSARAIVPLIPKKKNPAWLRGTEVPKKLGSNFLLHEVTRLHVRRARLLTTYSIYMLSAGWHLNFYRPILAFIDLRRLYIFITGKRAPSGSKFRALIQTEGSQIGLWLYPFKQNYPSHFSYN